MRRFTLLCLAAAAVTLLGAAPGSAKRDDPKKDGRTILVKFVQGIDADASVDDEGDKALGELKTKVRIVKVKSDSSIDDAIARYSARDDVEYAEANYVANADSPPFTDPNDPSYPSQWALAQMHAFDGWALYPGSYGVSDGTLIAIADSGVDSAHPDLAGQVDTADGASCLSGTCSSDAALDDNGHGTHVAGIAAASTDNADGIAGTAYASSVMAVKVLDSNGNGTYAGISSGIIWAADHGAEVINLSLSGAAYSKTMCDAVTYAISHGSVVVAAAGNDSTSIQEYPAACPGAIGVGATDSSGALAPFSDYGYPDVFVTAPGVSILSTYPGGGYATLSGTSMAAPYVSGLAALLRGESPGRTVADVKRIIASTADKVGGSAYGGDQFSACGGNCSWNSSFGYGRVNIASALAFVPSPDFAVSASPSSATARQGGSASFAVSVDALDGFNGAVSLSVGGLPAGATASFDSASIGVPGSAVLTVSASSTTPVGSYPLTISASDGSRVRNASATLVVAAPDFTISASPAYASVARGKSVTFAVSTGALGSFGGAASLSATGLGSGATASFSPSSVGAPGSSTLTITAGSSATLGTFTVTIKGTSGSLVRTTTIALSVVVADFTVSASPASVAVLQGSTASYAVSVGALNGFTGNITLSASGYPSGSTIAFSPSVVAAPGTSTFTVKTAATAPVGTYTLTIKGTSSSRVVHSTTVQLVVNPVGDFTFSVNPSLMNVPRGGRSTTYVSLTGQGGFYATVKLSASGLPAGVTATWGATSKLVSGTSTYSISLKIAAGSSVLPGTYTITLVATCGPIVHTTPLTVTVT